MDIIKDGPLEFLDFTGVDESQRKWLQSWLYSTTSNLPLPWIITENVPSLNSKIKYTHNRDNLQPVAVNHMNAENDSSRAFVSRSLEQGQFQPVYAIAPNLTTKFPASPAPFAGPYPATMMPMPSIYTNFHQASQPMRNIPSTLIPATMYSPETSYTYSQVSPVAASYDNLSQFSHNPQYGPNVPSSVSSHRDQNDAASAVSPERIVSAANNVPHQSQYIQATLVTASNALPLVNTVAVVPNHHSADINVNSDSYKGNIQKTPSIEKQGHPSHTVSYGVPNSSPFPANKEPNPVVCPSPVNKTDCEKVTSEEIKTEQSNATNGLNGNENSASGNKSWASLFNKDPSAGVQSTAVKMNGNVSHGVKDKENNNISCPIKNPKRRQFIDPTCYRMGEYLLSHAVDGRTISLQPRGLLNRSNYCYINSILQALLACPPLYNLLFGLSKNITTNEKRKPTPVIDSMCRLINEFEHLPAGQRVGRRTDKNQKKEAGVLINCGNPFEPSWIYKMLNGMRSDSFLIEGRQEDAEEFFGCLLNGLNDEIQELMKIVANDIDEGSVESAPELDQESEDWQVMGPKNKGSITRKMVFGRTPISNIFGGLLRSKIHRAGDESSNNIQPFFTLQLNIEKAKTVSEALEALVSKNQLEGVTSSKTNEQVEAWQQVMIEELPVVLVLHLKCFDYQLNGCTKIMKSLDFPIDLRIDSKLLSTKMNSSKEKQYKLFAVVYHDGKEASKGHYITDAFHVGYNSWLRYDDASIKAVSEEQVLSPQGCRVPYLLFYRRSDTIRSK